MSEPSKPHLILPVGTQVVTRVEIRATDGTVEQPTGAVGEVVAAPRDELHSYRIRLVDGAEVSLKRHELAIRKHAQRDGLERDEGGAAYFDYVIYRCVIGSRAYGLSDEGSDTDRRGFFLPPAELHWSLGGVPGQVEDKERDECYWELQKFISLALKANPTILECLYTPLVEYSTPLADELLSMRSAFLSKLVYQTYNGYVMSQFKKLEQDLRTRKTLRWKHAMHLVRLLLTGVAVLERECVPVAVEGERERLLAVRRGEVAWADLNEWRLSLHESFSKAYRSTRLPDRPDYDRANAFLVKARATMVEKGRVEQ